MHDCVQDVQVTMEIATWMRVGWGLGVGDGGFPMIYCDFGWGGWEHWIFWLGCVFRVPRGTE